MRILVVVSDAHKIRPTTQMLIQTARQLGCSVGIAGALSLTVEARRTPSVVCVDMNGGSKRQSICDFDVVWLRVNPYRHEAIIDYLIAVLEIGYAAEEFDIPVLNPPGALAWGSSKAVICRADAGAFAPNTLVSRDELVIAEHLAGQYRVLKASLGTGGTSVAFETPGQLSVNEVFERLPSAALVVQPTYPGFERGVDRVTVSLGRVLQAQGLPCAARRTPLSGAPLAATTAPCPELLDWDSPSVIAAATLAPWLHSHGVIHAGLGLIDGMLLEINVFAPGGLVEPSQMTGIDYSVALVETVVTWAGETR